MPAKRKADITTTTTCDDASNAKQVSRATQRSEEELARAAIVKSASKRTYMSLKIRGQFSDILSELRAILTDVNNNETGLPVFVLQELIAEYGVNDYTSTLVAHMPDNNERERCDFAVMVNSSRLAFVTRHTHAKPVQLYSKDLSSGIVVKHHEWTDVERFPFGICADSVRSNHVYVSIDNKTVLVNLESPDVSSSSAIVREFKVSPGSFVVCGLLISNDGLALYFMAGNQLCSMNTQTGLVVVCPNCERFGIIIKCFGWSHLHSDEKGSIINLFTHEGNLFRYNVKTRELVHSRHADLVAFSEVASTRHGFLLRYPQYKQMIIFCDYRKMVIAPNEKHGAYFTGKNTEATAVDGEVFLDATYSSVQALVLSHDERSLLVVQRNAIRKVPLPLDMCL
jgi:hypothetical protein